MFLLLRLAFGLIGLALVAIPAGLLALALTLPEPQALVAQPAEPTPAAVARARALLRRQDPRRQAPGTPGRVRLGQGEVDLALAALPQVLPGLRARVRLQGASALAQATLPLPANPLGSYFNFDAEFVNAGAGLAPRHLHLGPLAVPDALAGWLVGLVWAQVQDHPEWGPVARSVEGARLENGLLTLSYRVPAALPQQLRSIALGPAETATLAAYHAVLVQTLDAGSEPLPLPQLLAPLFQLAEARGGGADEYRAALLVAGVPLAEKSLATLVPEARGWPPLPRRAVTLADRRDSAQHFAASALLAAYAGTPLARAIGLWKELEDSRGRSGFSFADLAADAAGTRLGEELASGRPAVARRLAAGAAETDLLPSLADLPEKLNAAAFRARYGGPGDPRYAALAADIEARVAALPIYRNY